jgi:hypothetical protein
LAYFQRVQQVAGRTVVEAPFAICDLTAGNPLG